MTYNRNERQGLTVAVYNDNQGGWIDNILNEPGKGGYSGSAVVIDRISGGVLSTVKLFEQVVVPSSYLSLGVMQDCQTSFLFVSFSSIKSVLFWYKARI